MQKNKKSNNKSIMKLRMILDNLSHKDLRSDDEKYLRRLIYRLEKSSNDKVITRVIVDEEPVKKEDRLKPRVAVYLRDGRKTTGVREELGIKVPSAYVSIVEDESKAKIDEDIIDI
jgi:hypothetical protein